MLEEEETPWEEEWSSFDAQAKVSVQVGGGDLNEVIFFQKAPLSFLIVIWPNPAINIATEYTFYEKNSRISIFPTRTVIFIIVYILP